MTIVDSLYHYFIAYFLFIVLAVFHMRHFWHLNILKPLGDRLSLCWQFSAQCMTPNIWFNNHVNIDIINFVTHYITLHIMIFITYIFNMTFLICIYFLVNYCHIFQIVRCIFCEKFCLKSLCILFFIVLCSSVDMVLRAYRKYPTELGKMCNLRGQKIYVNSTVDGVIISDLLFSWLCFLFLLTEGASEVWCPSSGGSKWGGATGTKYQGCKFLMFLCLNVIMLINFILKNGKTE